jgi:hypothetical protein
MKQPILIDSYENFVKSFKYINENVENVELNIDTTILDKLIDLVGSEEDIEECAKQAYEELEKSSRDEENKFEFGENDTPENLAIAALLTKLVECGKLDPQDADNFLEENI